jgi:hypothetical protein
MWHAPIELDALGRGPRRRLVGWTVLALGVVALLGALNAWHEAREEAARLASETRTASAPVTAASGRPDPGAAARRGAIERELGAPWPVLFAALEATRTPAIRVLGVEASSRSGQVTIDGHAEALPELLAYIERLNASALSEVSLQSHRPATDVPDGTLRFQARARWSAGATVPRTTGADSGVPLR